MTIVIISANILIKAQRMLCCAEACTQSVPLQGPRPRVETPWHFSPLWIPNASPTLDQPGFTDGNERTTAGLWPTDLHCAVDNSALSSPYNKPMVRHPKCFLIQFLLPILNLQWICNISKADLWLCRFKKHNRRKEQLWRQWWHLKHLGLTEIHLESFISNYRTIFH